MFLAADAIDVAVQLNFVFETGFSNLQFMAMAAIADNAHDHLFEKALVSIQTDESRHAQIGHPGPSHPHRPRRQRAALNTWSTRCGGAVGGLFIALTGTAMEYLTPVRARTEVFSPVHGGVGCRAVHEEPGGVRPGAALVLGVVPGGAGLRPPQPATRPLRLPHHPVV